MPAASPALCAPNARRQARGTALRVRVLEEEQVPLYVLAKHPDGDAEALCRGRSSAVVAEVPAGWTMHRNGNNAAFLPPFLGKAACGRVRCCPELRRRHPDAPVIGIGDSLTDAPFMALVRLRDDAGRLAARPRPRFARAA